MLDAGRPRDQQTSNSPLSHSSLRSQGRPSFPCCVGTRPRILQAHVHTISPEPLSAIMNQASSRFLLLPAEIRVLIYRQALIVDEEEISDYGTKGPQTLFNVVLVCHRLRKEALPILYNEALFAIRIGSPTINFLGKDIHCTHLVRYSPPSNLYLMRSWIVIVDEPWMYETHPDTQTRLDLLAPPSTAAVELRAQAVQDQKDREKRTIQSLQWVLQQLRSAAPAPVDLTIRLQKSRACRVKICQPQPLRTISGPPDRFDLSHDFRHVRFDVVKVKTKLSLEGHWHPRESKGLTRLFEEMNAEAEPKLFLRFEQTVLVSMLQINHSTMMQKLWDNLFIISQPFFDQPSSLKALVYAAWQHVGMDDGKCAYAISLAVRSLLDLLLANEQLRYRLPTLTSPVGYVVDTSLKNFGSQRTFECHFKVMILWAATFEKCRNKCRVGDHDVSFDVNTHVLQQALDSLPQPARAIFTACFVRV